MVGDKVRKKIMEKKAVKTAMRHWMTVSFLFGFILDNLTLNRVDQLYDVLVLAFYVLLAMVSLLLLYASVVQKISGLLATYTEKYIQLVIQFSFGGLLSGMLIFYGRSGAWTQSWPFMLVILIAIYGNETIHDRASRLLYNLGILFIGLFAYVVLIVPVFIGTMGALVFVGSGLLALFIMYWFLRFLYKVIPNYMDMNMKNIIFSLGLIFVSFNFLYFTNIIPPIPLSLKEVGIYHSVVHFDNGQYQLKYEKGAWWQFFKSSDDVFHAQAGDSIFCFAKVYTPTRLATKIYHSWQYYDTEKKEWVDYFRSSYPIAGGRSEGYRGYTLIEHYKDGQWRCSVETGRGQVLGRVKFTVDSQNASSELVTRIE